jgi:hypothetical protein
VVGGGVRSSAFEVRSSKGGSWELEVEGGRWVGLDRWPRGLDRWPNGGGVGMGCKGLGERGL